MNAYFSSFISGFGEVIGMSLRSAVKELEIISLVDGFVVYKTTTTVQELQKLRFFNNSFIMIEEFENCSLEDTASKVLNGKTLKENIKSELKKIGKTFRIIFSDENKIVSIDKNKAHSLEQLFSKGLKIDRANPQVELWFLKRSEGNCFIGVRITRPDDSEKHLVKGELRPEMAHLLCFLSEPANDDIFLDPFAGSGAIVSERARYFPYNKIFAGEKDKQIFKRLQERILEEKLKVILGRWDATNLSSLTDNSIDKIVTDPPWGFFKRGSDDLEEFYKKMLEEFSRVMVSDGIAVILSGQKEILEKNLKKLSVFVLEKKLDVLVSGKKAGVYKLRRK